MGDAGNTGRRKASPDARHRHLHRRGRALAVAPLLPGAGRTGWRRYRRGGSRTAHSMILVAGGTGHLGTELIPLLTGRRLPVRVLTRDAARARRAVGDQVELAEGDVRDPPSLVAACEGVDCVVSAVTGFGPGGAGPRLIDHQGNLNLIAAAQSSGAGRFVLLSMVGASSDHPMELLRRKHRAEEALKASRRDWTILRPTVFMELWASILGDPIVRGGRTVVVGRGDNPVNFISAGDIARFVELAVRDPRLR